MELVPRTDDPIPAIATVFRLSIAHYDIDVVRELARELKADPRWNMLINLSQIEICDSEIISIKDLPL